MNEEKKKVLIYPCKTIRRIGVFLADFFIMLVLSVLLLEGLVLQVARPFTGYYSKINEIDEISRKEVDLYYENEILSYDEGEKYSFKNNLETTGSNYVSYMLQINDDPKADVFKTYFVNIRDGSIDKLNGLYIENADKFYDQNSKDINGLYVLKSSYLSEFEHKYIAGDEMSEIAKKDYDDYISNGFLEIYSLIVKDIEKNNLFNIDKTTSFLTYENRIKEINTSINNLYVYSSIGCFLAATFILYFAIPFIDKKGRTISMMILKTERISLNDYSNLSHRLIFSTYLLSVISNAVGLMFVPLMSVEFATLFSFTLLVVVSAASLVYLLINFIIMLSNSLKRSPSEFLTHSLVVDTLTMDNYYKEIENARTKSN